MSISVHGCLGLIYLTQGKFLHPPSYLSTINRNCPYRTLEPMLFLIITFGEFLPPTCSNLEFTPLSGWALVMSLTLIPHRLNPFLSVKFGNNLLLLVTLRICVQLDEERKHYPHFLLLLFTFIMGLTF